MANVYSVQLLAGSLIAGETEDADLVTGYVYVARDVTANVSADTTGSAQFAVTLGGIEVVTLYVPAGGADPIEWRGRIVVPGPSTITASLIGGTDAVATYSVSGYQLVLP